MSQYTDLTTETVNMVIDEIVAANKRGINYMKSVWDIVAKPLPATSEGVRNGFERADAVVSLTLSELETSLKESAEFAEKLVAQTTKIQEASFAALKEYAEKGYDTIKEYAEKGYDQFKDAANKGIENAKSVADAASEQMTQITKRVEHASEDLTHAAA